jgi:hypothetical protein
MANYPELRESPKTSAAKAGLAFGPLSARLPFGSAQGKKAVP